MKKKLLHLQLLSMLTGVQRFSLHLLDGLPESEYEIYVAAHPKGEFVSEIQKRGWNFIPMPSFRRSICFLDIVSFLHLLWILGKYRFDIVHANGSKLGLLGRLAARIMKVPRIVFTSHGTAYQPYQSLIVYRFYQILDRFANSLGDHTIYVNHCDRLASIDMGLVSENKAITIYNAMKDADKLQLERRLSGDIITIGSTLRFSNQKNVINLIIALCKACRKTDQLRFIVLGDGEHLKLCRSIVASYRLSERILLPGWDSEVAAWLKIFDVFILYSRWEAMPYSIIEAMYAGLPVIGSSIPSISEFVTEEVGWQIALDDEDSLIRCLVEIPQNPKSIIEKGKKAGDWVRQISDYSTMLRSYREVYEAGHRF